MWSWCLWTECLFDHVFLDKKRKLGFSKDLLDVKTCFLRNSTISWDITNGFSSGLRRRSVSLALIAAAATLLIQSVRMANKTRRTNLRFSGLDWFAGSGRYCISFSSSLTSFSSTLSESSLYSGTSSADTSSLLRSFFSPRSTACRNDSGVSRAGGQCS